MKKTLMAMAALALLTGATSSHKLTSRERAEHALSRLGFGARPDEADRIAAEGVDKWIDRQLHPERIDDAAVEARLASFQTLKMNNIDMIEQYYKPIVMARRAKKEGEEGEDTEEMKEARQKSRRVVGELIAQRIIRAAESDRQLNEVLVDFWLNHFNVFAGKGIDRFLLTGYERDVIRPHIWGKFEDLLMATAKSPAMMFYLDNARSRGGAINENYAREIMELHTLGVDGGYTQKDVTELARVFTGWSIGRPRDPDGGGAFLFRPFAHDRGEKTVLGVHFAAGGGIEEGERMIHVLAHHPSAAHHIALQLCQRLVADDPPKALVDRVAKTFLDSDGDLRVTVKAVIDSPEFWDPKAYRAKVKTPFEYVISALRASNAKVINPIPVARALQQIGEPLYGAQPPTGYSDKAEAWVNSGAEVSRMNFAIDLASNKLPGVVVQTPDANKLALQLGSPEFQRQ